MLLTIHTKDGTARTYIGISDFTLADDGTPIINWPHDLDQPTEQALDGELVRAAALPIHNVPGLKEVIRNNDNVTIGVSDEFPILRETIHELQDENPDALDAATIIESTDRD